MFVSVPRNYHEKLEVCVSHMNKDDGVPSYFKACSLVHTIFLIFFTFSSLSLYLYVSIGHFPYPIMRGYGVLGPFFDGGPFLNGATCWC